MDHLLVLLKLIRKNKDNTIIFYYERNNKIFSSKPIKPNIRQTLDSNGKVIDIGVVGSDAIVFHKDDKSIWTTYSDTDRTKVELLFSSSLIHPSVMMRESIIDKYKLFVCKQLERIL